MKGSNHHENISKLLIIAMFALAFEKEDIEMLGKRLEYLLYQNHITDRASPNTQQGLTFP